MIAVAAALLCTAAQAAETALISKNIAGTDAGNDASRLDSFGERQEPHLDRYIVFSSYATDLTSDPYPNGSQLVSVTPGGSSTNYDSDRARVSEDGRFVGFVTGTSFP